MAQKRTQPWQTSSDSNPTRNKTRAQIDRSTEVRQHRRTPAHSASKRARALYSVTRRMRGPVLRRAARSFIIQRKCYRIYAPRLAAVCGMAIALTRH